MKPILLDVTAQATPSSWLRPPKIDRYARGLALADRGLLKTGMYESATFSQICKSRRFFSMSAQTPANS